MSLRGKSRAHLDGVGDGLSIALDVANRAATIQVCRLALEDRLLRARRRKDEDTEEKLGIDDGILGPRD